MSVFDSYKIIFYIVPIISGLIFAFTLLMFLSPKFRGKFMSNQVKSMKHMTNYSKRDIEEIMTNLGSATVNSQNNIINQNEDTLKNIANKSAEINKGAIKTTVSAIKEGLNAQPTMFCKYCGAKIDEDSKFCKSCGKEQ